MNEIKREIKQALMGDLVPIDDMLVVSGRKMSMFRNGVGDGFGSVFFLGVMCRKRWYRSKKKPEFVEKESFKVMQGMGRIVGLATLPEAKAVFCRYLLGSPAILTLIPDEDGCYVASAYAGRGIAGLISVLRVQNRFRDAMSGILERLSEEKESDRHASLKEAEYDEKQRLREEKKARKKRNTRKQVK